MKPLSLHLESAFSNVPKGKMSRDADFFIIDKDFRPLLGAETCQELNLIRVMASDISESDTVNSVNDKFQTAQIVLTRDQIFKEYSDVSEGLECMDGPYHMELDEAVKPVVHPPRKVTFGTERPFKGRTGQVSQRESYYPLYRTYKLGVLFGSSQQAIEVKNLY